MCCLDAESRSSICRLGCTFVGRSVLVAFIEPNVNVVVLARMPWLSSTLPSMGSFSLQDKGTDGCQGKKLGETLDARSSKHPLIITLLRRLFTEMV